MQISCMFLCCVHSRFTVIYRSSLDILFIFMLYCYFDIDFPYGLLQIYFKHILVHYSNISYLLYLTNKYTVNIS